MRLIPEHTNKDTVARAQIMSKDFERASIRVSDAKTAGLELFRREWLNSGVDGASDDTISAAFYAWKGTQSHIWYPDTVTQAIRANEPKVMNPFAAIERAYYG